MGKNRSPLLAESNRPDLSGTLDDRIRALYGVATILESISESARDDAAGSRDPVYRTMYLGLEFLAAAVLKNAGELDEMLDIRGVPRHTEHKESLRKKAAACETNTD